MCILIFLFTIQLSYNGDYVFKIRLAMSTAANGGFFEMRENDVRASAAKESENERDARGGITIVVYVQKYFVIAAV